MKMSTRALLALVLFELIMAGLWYFLAINMAENHITGVPADMARDQREMGSMFGMIMGGVGGLLVAIFIMRLIRERKGPPAR
jgi:predicted lipid-binding transport protein (Tim44 family)